MWKWLRNLLEIKPVTKLENIYSKQEMLNDAVVFIVVIVNSGHSQYNIQHRNLISFLALNKY